MFTRIAAELLVVGARERGVVPKPAFIACGRDRGAVVDQFSCKEQALGGEIVSDGISGFLLEGMHQVIAADIELIR